MIEQNRDAVFQTEKAEEIKIPESFVVEHLQKIKDPDLFKLLLYIFWRFNKTQNQVNFINLETILNDEIFCENFGRNADEIKERVSELLSLALKMEILIYCHHPEQAKIDLYFYNSSKNKEIIELIETGDIEIKDLKDITLISIRPNIFKLYEENIGPLTPLIAETLEDASNNFSEHWIKEAIQIAVENNVRRWNYIKAILDRWQEEGKNARRDQKHTQEDREKYLKGKYSDLIKR